MRKATQVVPLDRRQLRQACCTRISGNDSATTRRYCSASGRASGLSPSSTTACGAASSVSTASAVPNRAASRMACSTSSLALAGRPAPMRRATSPPTPTEIRPATAVTKKSNWLPTATDARWRSLPKTCPARMESDQPTRSMRAFSRTSGRAMRRRRAGSGVRSWISAPGSVMRKLMLTRSDSRDGWRTSTESEKSSSSMSPDGKRRQFVRLGLDRRLERGGVGLPVLLRHLAALRHGHGVAGLVGKGANGDLVLPRHGALVLAEGGQREGAIGLDLADRFGTGPLRGERDPAAAQRLAAGQQDLTRYRIRFRRSGRRRPATG